MKYEVIHFAVTPNESREVPWGSRFQKLHTTVTLRSGNVAKKIASLVGIELNPTVDGHM